MEKNEKTSWLASGSSCSSPPLPHRQRRQHARTASSFSSFSFSSSSSPSPSPGCAGDGGSWLGGGVCGPRPPSLLLLAQQRRAAHCSLLRAAAAAAAAAADARASAAAPTAAAAAVLRGGLPLLAALAAVRVDLRPRRVESSLFVSFSCGEGGRRQGLGRGRGRAAGALRRRPRRRPRRVRPPRRASSSLLPSSLSGLFAASRSFCPRRRGLSPAVAAAREAPPGEAGRRDPLRAPRRFFFSFPAGRRGRTRRRRRQRRK